MNRKIMMSLGVVVFVAALSWGATGAFFSDSETSTGNTFTAGAIDLTVDSVQHYNGMVCVADGETYVWAPEANVTLDVNNQPVLGTHDFAAYNIANPFAYPQAGTACNGTWTATDLGAQTFWNFTDVKPGDEGENTISLHIDSNPAWACIDVSLTANDDVTCNDPENAAEGVGVCNTDGAPLFDGELAQNLKFAAWADDGDNVWEQGEPLLFSNQSGPASDVLGGKTYALADSVTGPGPLPGGSTSYIGLQWCAGTQTVNVGLNTITCDGAGMGNDAQTDSMTADVTFRVEQHRNNPNFLCSPRETEPVVTRVESPVLNFGSTGWGGWSCPANTTAIGGGTIGATEAIVAEGLATSNVDGQTYPVYPHYTFGAGETGYVVHNGAVGQSLQIFVNCQAN